MLKKHKKKICLITIIVSLILIATITTLIVLDARKEPDNINKSCDHVFDANCDSICNECGAIRKTQHIDVDFDKQCDYCQCEYIAYTISDDEYKKFNLVNTVLSNPKGYYDRTNVQFSNIRYLTNSTSFHGHYKSIVRDQYGNALYDYTDGTQRYVKNTENGELSVILNNNKTEPLHDLNISKFYGYEVAYPLLVVSDATFDDNNMYVSDSFMKKMLLYYLDNGLIPIYQTITSDLILDYSIVQSFFDNSTFVTKIEFDQDNIKTVSVELIDNINEQIYFSFRYENTNESLIITTFVDSTPVTNTSLIIIENYANFSVARGDNWFVINTNITYENVTIEYEQSVVDAFEIAEMQLEEELALRNKYPLFIKSSSTCDIVYTYDIPSQQYAVWSKYMDGYFMLEGFDDSIDTKAYCLGHYNEDQETINVFNHSLKEYITQTYSFYYQLEGDYSDDYDTYFVVTYDSTINMYVAFVQTQYGYFAFGVNEKLDREYLVVEVDNVLGKLIPIVNE